MQGKSIGGRWLRPKPAMFLTNPLTVPSQWRQSRHQLQLPLQLQLQPQNVPCRSSCDHTMVRCGCGMQIGAWGGLVRETCMQM